MFLFFFLQYWNEELAELAAEHAQGCNFVPNENRGQSIRRHRSIGENIGIAFSHNLTSLIGYWFSEESNYDYYSKVCDPDHYTYTCEHYLQVMY